LVTLAGGFKTWCEY